jgi:hypothetical protein
MTGMWIRDNEYVGLFGIMYSSWIGLKKLNDSNVGDSVVIAGKRFFGYVEIMS